MKQSKKMLSRFPFPALCIILVIGMLVTACSFAENSAATTPSTPSTPTQTTHVSPTATATPSPTTSSSHPVADQPARTIGQLPAGEQLAEDLVKPLVFNLAYNDTAMEQDLAQIYTLGSPTYHQFLTPDQVVQRYALSDDQQQQVLNWLTQHGYTVVSTDSMHSAIKVQATVATIEQSLGIKLKFYTLLGRQFFMQEGIPTLSGPIAPLVQSVIGLDNFAIPEFKPPSFGFAAPVQALGANCDRYGAKQTLTRNKLAAAYQVNQLYQQGFQGQGMTIGVAEFGEPYDPQDIANYAACAGIGTPNIQNIDVDGQLQAGPGQGEAALDLELLAGLAPQAQILDYQADTSHTSFAQALVDVFNKVAADNKVQVLSVSYGAGEGTFSTSEQDVVNKSLRTLAAEGISVFVSSGDCGAFGYRILNLAAVSFPASAPYAIAVGGTHLQVNDGMARTSETVWGDRQGVICQNQWGSGGGVSQNADFQRPSWQVGPGTTSHYDGTQDFVFTAGIQPVSAPNGLRQVPDVAAAAYPNIAIYYQGAWVAAGGTSAAAPIWAAGTVLVDQGLKQQGKALLGGVPEIYTLANNPGKYHPFTDITAGDNLFYPATPGWDYATGWGSPNFSDILQLQLSR